MMKQGEASKTMQKTDNSYPQQGCGGIDPVSGGDVARLTRPLTWFVLSICFAFYAFIVCLSEWDFIYYPLDDAYYYLNTAKHIAASGNWSFDGGVSTTNGFHPLYMGFCALVWLAYPSDPLTLARLIMLGNVLFGLGAASLLLRALKSLTGNLVFSLGMVAAAFLNVFALHMVTNLMESCLYLLCLAAVLNFMCRKPNLTTLRDASVLGCLVGLSVLARTEAILLVPFIAAYVLWQPACLIIRKWNWRQAFVVTAIPVVALLAFFSLSSINTGCWFQMSGRIHQFLKSDLPPLPGVVALFKASALAFSTLLHPFNAYTLSADNISFSQSQPLTLVFGLLCTFYLLALMIPSTRRALIATAPFIGFLIAVLLYYGIIQDGETHPRYQIGAFVAITVLLPAACYQLAARVAKIVGDWSGFPSGFNWIKRLAGCVFVVVILLAQVVPFVRPPRTQAGTRLPLAEHLHIACMRHRGTNKIPFVDMQRTAYYLRQLMPSGTILGGFDTGQHAYYSGFQTVNLDGVINNQAAVARLDGNLLDYILESPIEYVVQMQDHLFDYFHSKRHPNMHARSKLHLIQVDRVPQTVFYGGFGIYKVVRDPERYAEAVREGKYSVKINGQFNRERF